MASSMGAVGCRCRSLSARCGRLAGAQSQVSGASSGNRQRRLLSGGKPSSGAPRREADVLHDGEVPEPPSTMTTMASMGFGAIGAVGIAAVGVYGAFNMALWAARESGRSIMEERAAADSRAAAAQPPVSHRVQLEAELADLRETKRSPEVNARKAAIKKELKQM